MTGWLQNMAIATWSSVYARRIKTHKRVENKTLQLIYSLRVFVFHSTHYRPRGGVERPTKLPPPIANVWSQMCAKETIESPSCYAAIAGVDAYYYAVRLPLGTFALQLPFIPLAGDL